MPWKPDVCVYHGGCDDGFGAALAVWKSWADDVQYVPAGYGTPLQLPNDGKDKHILFVDFSLKQDAMRDLGEKAASIVILDHHKTAQAELRPWTLGHENIELRAELAEVEENLALNRMEGVLPIIAYFCMQKSGARMAWEFCLPHHPVPALIRAIEDRDLWRFALPSTREVSAALRTFPHNFYLWDGLSSIDLSALVVEGSAIIRGHKKNIESFLRNRYWTDVAWHHVPVVNVPYHYASDTAHELLAIEPEAPFAACWFQRGDGKVQWSLRSEDSRMDVSEVARSMGGGGHRNAAGFEEVGLMVEGAISRRHRRTSSEDVR